MPLTCMFVLNVVFGPAKPKEKSPLARPPWASTLKLVKSTCLVSIRRCDLAFVVGIDPKRTESDLKSPSATWEEAGPVNASKSTCFS